jgi:hypothetical protein
LESFSSSTGLKINYAKSCLVPINLNEEKTHHLSCLFGCKVESLLFTYLGLPLGTTKPRVEHNGQIMNNTERKLSSISSVLSQAGRLQLVNSVITSLPTYMMCTLEVLVAVLEYIDRTRRHCLWRNSDCNAKDKPPVASKKMYKDKEKRRPRNSQSQESEFLSSNKTPGQILQSERFTLGQIGMEFILQE